MKTATWIIAMALLLASTAGALAAVEFDVDGAVPGKWTMDLDAAKKLAAEKQLPILLDFSGSDWCGWCKIMEENVFTKPEWKAYAQENLVMVLLDYPRDKSLVPEKYIPRNIELRTKYGVRGYPTFVVLDADGETELGRLGSGRDKTPESFQEELKGLFRFRPAEIAKYTAALSPDDQTAYRNLIEKMAEDKQALKREEKEYAEVRSKISKLTNSIKELEKQMLEFRVAQLDEDGQRQFKNLEDQLAEAKQKLSNWFKTKPEQNEENNAKYKTMNDKIKEIEKEIAQY